MTPGPGPFLAPARNLNKLGSGLPGDATYQISRLRHMASDKKLFFHVFHYISLCKTSNPRGGAIIDHRGII